MKIVVSGSMQKIEEMVGIVEQLRKLGHTAETSQFASEYIGKTDAEKEKLKLEHKNNNDAIREYWDLMQDCDALLVANYDKNGIKNYIGGNAFLEMGFAYVLGQKIYLMNPAPDMPYYGTEIIAMKPIVLNGDLSKIA